MAVRRVRVLLAAGLFLALHPASGRAEAFSAAPDKGSFTLLVENDLFYKTDHDYTNGLEFAYTTAPDDSPGWAVDAARSIPFFAQTGEVRTRFALGQNMFTPDNLSLTNPPLASRPYAGFLYGAVGVVADTGTVLDQLQLSLGMVGPASLAEESQKFVHSILNDRKPMGWSTQLRDEPGLILEYNRSVKLIAPQSVLGAVFDVEPNYGAAIGNIYDFAEAGAMARLGFNLPRDYGPMRIAPSLPGSDYFEPTAGLGAYVFAGVDGRAVARNLFLDGNSFQSSRKVDKMNLVGDVVLGAAVTFNSIRLAFTHDIRSREYKTQPAADQFGAVDLTIRF
jgi:lipid A 3-O-deacylase